MKTTKLAATAILLAGFATAAHAVTVTQTGTVPTQKTDFTASFGTFNAFNTALGTLNSVVVTFAASAQDSGTLTNTSTGEQTFTFSTNNSTFVSGASAPSALINAFGGGSAGKLAFGSPTVFYDLAGGASSAFPPSPATNGFNPGTATNTVTFTSAADIGGFEGSSFSANLSTLTGQTFTGGGGNITAALTTTEGGSLTVAYNYTAPTNPVPEPSTLAVLGVGLVGLGFMRRRKSV